MKQVTNSKKAVSSFLPQLILGVPDSVFDTTRAKNHDYTFVLEKEKEKPF
jgi:hypothetical protein